MTSVKPDQGRAQEKGAAIGAFDVRNFWVGFYFGASG